MMLNSDGGLIKDYPKKMKFNSGAITSIRKTKSSTQSLRKAKKRLKREIDRLYLDKFAKPLLAEDFWEAICIYNSIHRRIDNSNNNYNNLKGRKMNEIYWITSYRLSYN